jgi:hypothetical protein
MSDTTTKCGAWGHLAPLGGAVDCPSLRRQPRSTLASMGCCPNQSGILTSGGSVTVMGTVVKSGSSKGTFQTAPGSYDLAGKPFSLSGSWSCHGKFNKE